MKTANRLCFVFASAALAFAGAAQAATYTVTTLDGASGTCTGTTCPTLRAAVSTANGTPEDDFIVFAPGLNGAVVLDNTVFISATEGGLVIDGDTDGDGKADVSLSGGGVRRAVVVQSGAAVTLNRLNIVDGRDGGSGGGIWVQQGASLTLNHVALSGNIATGDGGAIYNAGGTVIANYSALSGNQAGSGAAVYNLGGVATINHSTLSGNGATTSGGGVYASNFGGVGGEVHLNHSTVKDNIAANGGGVYLFQSGVLSDAILSANGSIIADNTGGDCFRSSGTVNASHTLIRDGLGCVNGAGSADNLSGEDPLLGPLQDNGGPTLSRLPAAASPVLDAVDCDAFPGLDTRTDQRGAPRPGGARCDLGAVERVGYLLVDTEADEVEDNGECSLREAIANANSNDDEHPDCAGGIGDDFIRFAPNVAAILIAFAKGDDGQFVLGNLDGNAGKLTLDGSRPGKPDVVLDGGDAARVLLAGASSSAASQVDLRHLGITGGQSAAGSGLYVYSNAEVRLSRCVLAGNQAVDFGGAIENNGTLRLDHCTLSDNGAQTGGGLYNRGTLILNHSTLAGNSAGLQGGGLFQTASAAAALNASVLADNSGGQCIRISGSIAARHALIEDDLDCVTIDEGGNLTADPVLGALADNGGGTPSHLPRPGSPLVDAAPCDLVAGLDNEADQRGVARPQGAQCDIGAVEARQYVLSLTVSGGDPQNFVAVAPAPVPGTGIVDGCSVGSTCTAAFVETASLTLTAQPAARWAFAGWGGDCAAFADNPVATPTMDQGRECSAGFANLEVLVFADGFEAP